MSCAHSLWQLIGQQGLISGRLRKGNGRPLRKASRIWAS